MNKKAIYYISLSILFCQLLNAQNGSVEKSVFGAQVGILGIWGNWESKLSSNIVLRSELGFDSGVWSGSFYPKTGFLMVPVITLEPRLYYNLDRRIKKNRDISNNSGNFISLKTSYHPDWFVISNYDNINIISDISIIPTWGIRRHLGKHFNYETGIGIGYRYYFGKSAVYTYNTSDAALNLHLRIGYTF